MSHSRHIPHRPAAVLLDAAGTLLRLAGDPAPALAAALARAGHPAPLDRVRRALAAEIDHYRAHHIRGADPDALAELRRECARVLVSHLPAPPPAEVALPLLLEALRFEAFPDAPALLRRLRDAGIPVAVVSNWDCALPEVLDRLGMTPLVDAVVTSAAFGAAKPDPAVFHHALALLGVPPGPDVVHCGDDVVADLGGARAAGCTGVLLDRHDAHPGEEPRVRTLAALWSHRDAPPLASPAGPADAR
ncbi:MAG: HAD family hydrolase [Thermoleophilia bacterium]